MEVAATRAPMTTPKVFFSFIRKSPLFMNYTVALQFKNNSV
jgi:hypothetical protein